MTPKQFVELYNKVSRVEFEATLKNGRVWLKRTGQLAKQGGILYLNCSKDRDSKKKWKNIRYKKTIRYKDNVWQFFENSKIAGVKHTGLTADATSHPFAGFTRAYFMPSFCGQGCPDMLLAINQFITYYENYKFFKKNKKLPNAAYIKKLVKKKLGLECVGFVGNFLKCNYIKHRQIKPANMTTKHFKKFRNRQKDVSDVSDVSAKAIVIFRPKTGSHIAIIDRILSQRKPNVLSQRKPNVLPQRKPNVSNVLRVQLCEAHGRFLRCRPAEFSYMKKSFVFKMTSPRKCDVRIYNLKSGSSTRACGACGCGIKWLKKHPLLP